MAITKKQMKLLENVFDFIRISTIHIIQENEKTNTYSLEDINSIQYANFILMQELEKQFGVETEHSTKKVLAEAQAEHEAIRKQGYTDTY